MVRSAKFVLHVSMKFSENNIMPILQLSDNCISGNSFMCCVFVERNYGNSTLGSNKFSIYSQVIDGGFLITKDDEEWLKSLEESNTTLGLGCFPHCRTFEK